MSTHHDGTFLDGSDKNLLGIYKEDYQDAPAALRVLKMKL